MIADRTACYQVQRHDGREWVTYSAGLPVGKAHELCVSKRLHGGNWRVTECLFDLAQGEQA